MPEISYAMRINVLQDTLARAKKVGAYQAIQWLESYIVFLERKENESVRARIGRSESNSLGDNS